MSAVIRPCVLEWAQRRGGRDDDDMRGRFANWDRWLAEEERPGFSEVEAIADFTHVPVGYLFLSEPPQEELPIPDFRAGRGPDIAPSGDLLETIYLNQRRQGWYEDYLTEFGDADPLPFVGSARHASVERAADMIRKELNYGIEVRLRMRSIDEARAHLIESFEVLGGLVVLNSIVENNAHRPLDIDEFRGSHCIQSRRPSFSSTPGMPSEGRCSPFFTSSRTCGGASPVSVRTASRCAVVVIESSAGAMRWPLRSPCRSPICAPNSTPAPASPRNSNVWPTDTGAPLSSF